MTLQALGAVGARCAVQACPRHSTFTPSARWRGMSTSVPRAQAVCYASHCSVATPEGRWARRLRAVGPSAQILPAGYLLKMACTEALAPIVRLHTGAVPLQAPPQPTKLLPAGAVAVSVTAVLWP